jgi:hypothetical protein
MTREVALILEMSCSGRTGLDGEKALMPEIAMTAGSRGSRCSRVDGGEVGVFGRGGGELEARGGAFEESERRWFGERGLASCLCGGWMRWVSLEQLARAGANKQRAGG